MGRYGKKVGKKDKSGTGNNKGVRASRLLSNAPPPQPNIPQVCVVGLASDSPEAESAEDAARLGSTLQSVALQSRHHSCTAAWSGASSSAAPQVFGCVLYDELFTDVPVRPAPPRGACVPAYRNSHEELLAIESAKRHSVAKTAEAAARSMEPSDAQTTLWWFTHTRANTLEWNLRDAVYKLRLAYPEVYCNHCDAPEAGCGCSMTCQKCRTELPMREWGSFDKAARLKDACSACKEWPKMIRHAEHCYKGCNCSACWDKRDYISDNQEWEVGKYGTDVDRQRMDEWCSEWSRPWERRCPPYSHWAMFDSYGPNSFCSEANRVAGVPRPDAVC